ncbi:5-oxoprolinase subunit PxpB [Cloacibacillus porcorum]|jgi:inhibitor of KinA|uniref:Allophanate hydrolase n=1 Tax=Cloacibacillus porcorum TaxID=1197717 RepID=A0A1B2I5A5_9BACT|nr:5-oxoprolinase subunit PxpB [Cloacibacillus porcorum]ANZ45152.1 allophanate hydrolase [Cloacibacillus porcorum]MCC8184081.1 5-oxoprolinase subunit PxpB [Cloacibacillus porcorum]MCD7875765.1 5-oxoprolinase subunit PxpB [Cloacibacillus porcorum]MDD7648896.1 5-oxoprolinase subunit PxpB [Cloacibacillus porcorum]MDY4094907.1 5-oxoprolinase subunit PxpB [Cloacibacillus porcorum]
MSVAVYIDEPKYLNAGESCVVIEFADEIDRGANDAVMNLKKYLLTQKNVPVVECLPTYRSLAVYFDPNMTSAVAVIKEAQAAPKLGGEASGAPHTEIAIPVCYGGEYGPDIANVAEHAGISEEEVVKRHSAKACHCYMIGFMPGFAYLGGMDESIATPRLTNPRTVIKGGSVGIAGKQTGIYPIDSPGGWQLIGRTPLRLFTPEASRPTLIEAGYEVRFVPVTEEEYKKIEAEVAVGAYVPVITEAV